MISRYMYINFVFYSMYGIEGGSVINTHMYGIQGGSVFSSACL